MKKIAILGGSGHGKVVADIAILNDCQTIDFFDDAFEQKKKNGSFKIVGDFKVLANNINKYDGIIVAIGDNKIRERKFDLLVDLGANLITLIHPSAVISPSVTIGEGSVVMANVVINADSIIGRNCIINSGAIIEHDCCLQDSIHVSPNSAMAGNVSVSNRSWIGLGATINQGVRIGQDAVIGAGAVVIRDVLEKTVVVGVPATVMRKEE